MNSNEDIVISGISGRFPNADSVEEFWENLINGVDMVTADNRRWPMGYLGTPQRKGTLKVDLTKFDAKFFGIFPKQAEHLDPQIRQLLEVTHEAILDAGVNPVEIRGKNVGVYVGASALDTYEAYRKHPDTASGYDITGSTACMLANRVSYAFDFRGPSFCLDTFCSSSMMALHQALIGIRTGGCDAAVVSGVNLLLNPITSFQIFGAGALSPDGCCKAFDASGNGFVRSDAIVSIFLQKKDFARRSYGTLLHSKSNTDGYKIKGISNPSGAVQQELLESVYGESGINPLDVFYVEPHGTGTAVGDPQEVNAIAAVFTKGRKAEYPLLIGATKSNMGHAEPAAALCAIVKVALALKHGVIPANLHFSTPNPNIPALLDGRIQVVTQNTPIHGNIVGITSTGVGGSNVHVILGANEKRKASDLPSIPVLIPFSGRTSDAVTYGLTRVKSTQRSFEFETLLQKIAEISVPGHDFRGYAILSGDETRLSDAQEGSHKLPPLWLIFSGMGTLWDGMATDLMEIEIFTESIQRSHKILLPFGFNLLQNLKRNGGLDNTHLGTCFIAMGIGFVDILISVGIKPDGYIGHSIGEMICAYIDGAMSQRELLICYYLRDEGVAKCNNGAMASIGLTWDEAVLRCPSGIYPACHNAENNVTVSGPAELITKFVQELKSGGIFAREIETGGVAYHSPYLAPMLPTFKAHVRASVVNNSPRTNKWRSTSRPEEDWNKPMDNAEYILNNMMSPVRFHSTITKHIPSNAVVLEVSAHALFVSVLKKMLPPSCSVIGLMRKQNGNTLTQLLTTIGQLYQFGYNLNLSVLYPKVSFPVSVNTPMISPLVKWDHSETHPLPDYISNSHEIGESRIQISLAESQSTDAYLAGHNIGGRILYPGAGHLFLVWKKFAQLLGISFLKLAITFENVQFEKPIWLSVDRTTKLTVNISLKTGEFQISEGEYLAVRGRIKSANHQEIFSKSFVPDMDEGAPMNCILTTEDAYKLLRIQGYNYEGVFAGLRSIDIEIGYGRAAWQDNWVAYLDSLIQFPIFSKWPRRLYIISGLRMVTINPMVFLDALNQNPEFLQTGIPMKYDSGSDTLQCPGIQLTEFSWQIASHKHSENMEPILEEAKWAPYISSSANSLDQPVIFSSSHPLFPSEMLSCVKYFIDLALENVSTAEVSICEYVPLFCNNLTMGSLDSIRSQMHKTADITIVSNDSDASIEAQLAFEGVRAKSKWEGILAQILISSVTTDLVEFVDHLTDNGFLLLKLDHAISHILENLALVSSRVTTSNFFYMYRKRRFTDIQRHIVNIDEPNYDWIENLQTTMREASISNDDYRIYITSTMNPTSGIVGLVNCLRLEPGGQHIRCVVSDSQHVDFNDSSNALVQSILHNDLVMNIIVRGVLGSYRHFVLDEDKMKFCENISQAVVTADTTGDLTGLKFTEASLPTIQSKNSQDEYCKVYYAAVNLRDVLQISGKLPLHIISSDVDNRQNFGCEFVGKDVRGNSVMGLVKSKGLATHVLPDPVFLWELPKKWTMEDAATVPLAYATVYYSLILRGKLVRGENILINGGSDGIREAAIAVSLNLQCKVLVTFISNEDMDFLTSQFSELQHDDFVNIHGISLQKQILNQTHGRGVDVVLNTIHEDNMLIPSHCLSEDARFLQIGNYGISKTASWDLGVCLKNITHHEIFLEALFEKPRDQKIELFHLVSQGIQNGVVRPLSRMLFTVSQLGQAFGTMVWQKFLGKVVIQLRGERDGIASDGQNISVRRHLNFDAHKVYIIIGGLGGVGFELAGFMVSRGARRLILISTFTSVKNAYQGCTIRKWTALGVKLDVLSFDLTRIEGATELLSYAKNLGDIGGIFNLAMVLNDKLFQNHTRETFEIATKPKFDIVFNLDVASRKICSDVEYFVVLSSIVAGRGNIGQTNYGFANSCMERICEARKQDGLSGLAIQFGAIADVGVIHEKLSEAVNLRGTSPQLLLSCLQTMETFLAQKSMTVVASTVFRKTHGKVDSGQGRSLVDSVANILGWKRIASRGNKEVTLGELGIDSLMFLELKLLLQSNGFDLSAADIRELTWKKLEEMNQKH